MIINFLKIFTEYVGIALCAHKVVGKRVKLNWFSLFCFAFYFMLVLGSVRFGKEILYVYWFLYMRIKIVDTWKQTIKPYIVTICTIPILQLLIYAVIGKGLISICNIYLIGTITNIIIILFLAIWKEKYLIALMNLVTKFRKIIFLTQKRN